MVSKKNNRYVKSSMDGLILFKPAGENMHAAPVEIKTRVGMETVEAAESLASN